MYELKNLSKMKTPEMNAPEGMRAYVAFDKVALAEGAIPGKYKELMALAVAFTTQCPYCLELHAAKARGRPARRTTQSMKPCSLQQPCALVPRSPTAHMP
jgi:AhpD family alkylhydroperoxidase